jgi:hypothetical protein
MKNFVLFVIAIAVAILVIRALSSNQELKKVTPEGVELYPSRPKEVAEPTVRVILKKLAPPDSIQFHSPDQGPSGKCECGSPMTITPANLSGHPRLPIPFSWDGSLLCKGLQWLNPSGTFVLLHDGKEVKRLALIDSFGTGEMVFPESGDYSMSVDWHAVCWNAPMNCMMSCSLSNTASVDVR